MVSDKRTTQWRPWLAAGVLAAGLFGATMASSAFPASSPAAVNNFCPPVSGSQVLISANGRCVSARYYYLNRVTAVLSNGSGVDHCAVGKQYSDGSGANVIEAACGTAQTVRTACYSSRSGYATIINRSNYAHYYYGTATYSSVC